MKLRQRVRAAVEVHVDAIVADVIAAVRAQLDEVFAAPQQSRAALQQGGGMPARSPSRNSTVARVACSPTAKGACSGEVSAATCDAPGCKYFARRCEGHGGRERAVAAMSNHRWQQHGATKRRPNKIDQAPESAPAPASVVADSGTPALDEARARLARRAKKPPKQRFDELVASGIVTTDGKVTSDIELDEDDDEIEHDARPTREPSLPARSRRAPVPGGKGRAGASKSYNADSPQIAKIRDGLAKTVKTFTEEERRRLESERERANPARRVSPPTPARIPTRGGSSIVTF